MTRLITIGLFFILSSCLDSRYPTLTKKHEGVVMTCVTDSVTLVRDTIIKIKGGIFVTARHTCINCKYYDCPDKPDYFEFAEDWPGRFEFDFKKKRYYFMNNPRPFDPNIKFGDSRFGVRYDLDYGPLTYNKKNKTITLESVKYEVKRTYYYEYTRHDSVLTLRRKNGY